MDRKNLSGISEEIRQNNGVIGKNIYYYDALDSTMNEAKTFAKNKSEEGTAIIAKTQACGRGRLGKNWSSPTGGIWMSVILYPKLSPDEVSLITLSAGIAVCTVIEKFYNFYPGLKWPNDVLLNGKKVCGILTEGNVGPDGLEYAILGIGLNLNFDKSDLPDGLKECASTIISETGILFKTEQVLKYLLHELDTAYNLFASDRKKILKLWESYSVTLGQRVSAFFENEKITGTAIRLTEKGGLIIQLDESDKEIEISSGEVSIRPV